MIPKNIFLYWGGGRLSYLRYLTIASLRIQNPSWKIYLFSPHQREAKIISWSTYEQSGEYTGECWLDRAKSIADVVENISMNVVGMSDDMSEIYKSDILRNYFLLTIGGIWSDIDIFYFKPIPDDILYKDFVCFDNILRFYSIGFLGAEIGSKYYSYVLQIQKSINNKNVGYEGYGNCIINGVPIDTLQKSFDVYNLPMHFVYPKNSRQINEIFGEPTFNYHDSTIGIHWYAGHPTTRHWENVLIPEKIYDFNNLLCNKIKEFKEIL